MSLLIRLIDWLVAITRQGSRVVAWGLGLLLLGTIGLIIVGIVSRRFGLAIQGVEEVSGYMLALISSWGLAYSLHEKAHIRIDVAYGRLPALLRSSLDIVALLALTGVSLVISWYAWPVLEKSIRNESLANTALATPLWIPQVIWFAGYLWFSLVSVILTLRVLLAVCQCDGARIDALIGLQSEAELVQDEARAAAQAAGTQPTS